MHSTSNKSIASSMVSLISSGGHQAKQKSKSAPWVGSYFGIPKPENYTPFVGVVGSELEIHILKKDLTVRHMVLQHNAKEAPFLESDILIQLENMAYIDDSAIAFRVYHYGIDTITGERIEGFVYAPTMRVDKTRWCRMKFNGVAFLPDYDFSPDIYQVLSKYRSY